MDNDTAGYFLCDIGASDPDGDPLTYFVGTVPSGGPFTMNSSSGIFQ